LAAFALGMYPNYLVWSGNALTAGGELRLPENPETRIKLGQSSACVSYLESCKLPSVFSYNALQMKFNSAKGPEAVAWDISICDPIVYLLLAGKDVNFNPLAEYVSLDGKKAQFRCVPKTASLLLNFREALKIRDDNLFRCFEDSHLEAFKGLL
jgi:hypothetical protein